MSRITINGTCIEFSGSGNICIQNGKVIVDGQSCNIGNAVDVSNMKAGGSR